jgi:hypothetical protein
LLLTTGQTLNADRCFFADCAVLLPSTVGTSISGNADRLEYRRSVARKGCPFVFSSPFLCVLTNRTTSVSYTVQDVLYGQVIKTRSNDRIVKVERRAVIGAYWRLEKMLGYSEDSSKLNTSFIERLNLTIRQASAYLFRRRFAMRDGGSTSKITSS